MNNEQFLMVKKIIDEDHKKLNIDDLRKLRDLLNEKINDLDKELNNGSGYILTDEDFEKKKNILLKDFRTFCEENITKPRFNPKAIWLYNAFLGLHGIDSKLVYSVDLKIYQTLGLNRKKLLRYRNVGDKMLNTYDEALKKYGLDLSNKLTDTQLDLLSKKNSFDTLKR